MRASIPDHLICSDLITVAQLCEQYKAMKLFLLWFLLIELNFCQVCSTSKRRSRFVFETKRLESLLDYRLLWPWLSRICSFHRWMPGYNIKVCHDLVSHPKLIIFPSQTTLQLFLCTNTLSFFPPLWMWGQVLYAYVTVLSILNFGTYSTTSFVSVILYCV